MAPMPLAVRSRTTGSDGKPAIQLEFADQGATGNPQKVRRFLLVAVGLSQDFKDGLLFETFERAGVFGDFGAGTEDFEREVSGEDFSSGGEYGGFVQRIFQFAHVARPLVFLQKGKRFPAE